MQATTTIALAALALALSACDARDAPQGPPPADQVPSHAPISDASPPTAEPPAPAAKTRPEGGLALGERVAAFEILNCESGEVYCQVCRYGSNPKIMAVGTLDDPEFEQDLRHLDALVDKFGADVVKAFAVIAVAEADGLVTPMGDTEALVARAKALEQKLDLSFPVVIPAAKDGEPNAVFEDYYAIARSRTIMFSNRDNRVRYSAVAPVSLEALDAAIAESLAG